jgi:hypothetical protein
MKWIKLSDELPPFNKEIVLLSERGFTRLTFRKTKEATDKFQALLRNACKRIANIDNPSPMYNEMGLPVPNKAEYKWKYWCLLPDKPFQNKGGDK